MLSKNAAPKLSPKEMEMRRAAQQILRHSFKHAFDVAAEKTNREREEIRRQSPELTGGEISKLSGDPYRGIRMPVKPNNNRGTDAKPEAFDSRYDDNKKSIDFHYGDLAKRLNVLIGKRFSLARVETLREELAKIWGEQVNLRLPFRTGLEAYDGSQYMEAVLGRDGKEFVVNGYSQNWANKHHLR